MLAWIHNEMFPLFCAWLWKASMYIEIDIKKIQLFKSRVHIDTQAIQFKELNQALTDLIHLSPVLFPKNQKPIFMV